MTLRSWINQIFGGRPHTVVSKLRPGSTAARRRPRLLPCLEALEDRLVPSSNFGVTTNADGTGQGTLRWAVDSLQPGSNTITFAPNLEGDTITLTQGQLVINQNVTIIGPAPGIVNGQITQLAVSGDGQSRIFDIQPLTGFGPRPTVQISNLTMEDGYANDSNGGAILNNGNLTLIQSTVSGSMAEGNNGGSPSSNANLGAGGGISNQGSLYLEQSTISGNTSQGGNGGKNYPGGSGGGGAGIGGGIYNSGSATIVNSTIYGNIAVGGAGGAGGGIEGNTTSIAKDGDGANGGGNGGSGGSSGSRTPAPYGGFGGGGGGGYSSGVIGLDQPGGSGGFGGGGGGGGAYTELSPYAAHSVSSGGQGGTYGGRGGNGGHTAGSEVGGNGVPGAPYLGGGGGGGGIGGGIFSKGTLTVTASTISGNSAEGGAGGTYPLDSAPASALGQPGQGAGGGVFMTGIGATASLDSTIIADNTADVSPDARVAFNDSPIPTGSFSGDYNLIGNATGANGLSASASAHNILGINNTTPLVSPLAYNGGLTETMALPSQVTIANIIPGPNPALDAGDPGDGVSVDQRGFPRSSPPDIGAYEVQPSTPTLTATPVGGTTVTLGTSPVTLKDTAALSGNNDMTGTLTFDLILNSTFVDFETVAISGPGDYTTPAYTLPTDTGAQVTGTYKWFVAYSGDSNNNSVLDDVNSNNEVQVNAASPQLTASPSPASVAIGTSGEVLTDTATLSGGYYETGHITFNLYAPNDDTPVDSETDPVNGNGTYTTPTGYTLPTDAAPGTYQWDVTYNGDHNNNAVSDNNDANNQVQAVVGSLTLTYGGKGTVLSLTENNPGNTPSITVSEDAEGLVINLGTGIFSSTSTAAGGLLAYPNSHEATIAVDSANPIGSLTASLPGDTLNLVSIQDGGGQIGSMNLSANVVNVTAGAFIQAGAANLTLSADTSLVVNSGALLQAQAGNITLEANQGTTAASGDFVGIDVDGAIIKTTGGGNILLQGQGGDDSTSDYHVGVQVDNGAEVETTGTGAITLTGTGGTGTDNDFGVDIQDSHTRVSTAAGALSVTGIAGAGTDGDGIFVDAATVSATGWGTLTLSTPDGVLIQDGAMLSTADGGLTVQANQGATAFIGIQVSGATLETTGAGAVVLTGTGGRGGSDSNNNWGVDVEDGSQVSTVTGDLTLNGAGGYCNYYGSGDDGVVVQTGSEVDATAGGAVTISGTGGSCGQGCSADDGVVVQSDGQVDATAGGAVTITGTGGYCDFSSSANDGVVVQGGGQVNATAGAAVTISGTGGSIYVNNSSADDGVVVQTGGQVNAGGSVTITGIGGSVHYEYGASGNYGVVVQSGGRVNATAGGAVTINGTGGAGSSSDGVAVENSGTTVSSQGGAVAITGSASSGDGIFVDAATLSATGSGTLTLSTPDNVLIQDGAMLSTAARGLTVQAGDGIFVDAATVSATGSGTLTLSTPDNVLIQDGAMLSTADGGLTVQANQGATASSGDFIGIQVSGATLETTGTGNILLQGQGGDDPTSDYHVGVQVDSGAEVETTGKGTITLTGTGGTGSGSDDGVAVEDSGTTVSSQEGTVAITGSASSGYGIFVDAAIVSATGSGTLTLSTPDGVLIQDGAMLSTADGGLTVQANQGATAFIGIQVSGATLETTGAGAVVLTGTGGRGGSDSNNNWGVDVEDGSQVSTVTGDLTLNGAGGYCNYYGSGDDGVVVQTGSEVDATAGGAVTISGTGGSCASGCSADDGVLVQSDGQVDATAGGAVTITGTGGYCNFISSANDGVVVQGGGQVNATAGGAVTITGTGGSINVNNSSADDGVVVQTGGQVSTVTGDLTLKGTGGSVDNEYGASGNYGVVVQSGGRVNATAGGAVTINGTGGAGSSSDGVAVENSGTTVSSQGGAVAITGSASSGDGILVDAATVSATRSGTLTLSTPDNVLIQDGALLSTADGGLTVQAGDGIFVDAATVSATGSGTLTLSTPDNVLIQDGALLSTADGGLTVQANQGATASSGNVIGIQVSGATLETTGTGNILLQGQGGDDPWSDYHVGVQVDNGAEVETTGTGAITLTGTGGTGTDNDFGVDIQDAHTQVTTAAGALSVIGIAGAGTGDFAIGVRLYNSSTVSAGGAGTVTLTGTGGSGGNNNWGVDVEHGSQVTTAAGALTLSGTGGNGSGSGNYGVVVQYGAQVNATGGGAVSLTGTGGAGTGNDSGVVIEYSGTQVTTAAGALSVTGTAGAGTGDYAVGVAVYASSKVSAGGAGALTLTGTGGSGGNNNWGVEVDGAQVSTAAGALTLTGTGGTGTGSGNDGVIVSGGGQVNAGGAVTINGTGGAGTGSDEGVAVENSGTAVSSQGGAVAITGSASSGDGIFVDAATVSATGSGSLTLSTPDNVVIQDGAMLSTADGGLTVQANQGATASSGDFIGIQVSGATLETTGAGNILLQGQGGNDPTSDNHFGVQVDNGAEVETTGTGAITLTGTGGAGTGDDFGVEITNDGTQVTTAAGALTVTGTGGSGGNYNWGVGVDVENGSQVTTAAGDLTLTGTAGAGTGGYAIGVRLYNSTVSAGGAGTATLAGTGGNGANNNWGVDVESGSQVTTAAGALTLSGTGGNGSGSGNYGVVVQYGAQVNATAGGAVAITGTGGAGSGGDDGVDIQDTGTQVTAAGAVTLTGTAGDAASVGVVVQDSASVSVPAGTLTVSADTLTFDGTATVSAGVVTLEPLPVGTSGDQEGDTLTFALYGPNETNDNSLLDTETVPVNADGSYTAPSYTLPSSGPAAGRYDWYLQSPSTVTVTDAGGTYNGLAFAATATVAASPNGTPAASLEGVAPTLEYQQVVARSAAAPAPTPNAPTAAGTYTVTATFPGSTDYTSSTASTTFTVTPALLTVAANAQLVTHGNSIPTLTASYSGFVNGQTLASSGVTGNPALTTTATSSSPVGTYPITAGLGTLTDADYTFQFVNSVLYITSGKTALGSSQSATVTTTSAATVTVGSSGAPQMTATGSGFNGTLSAAQFTGDPDSTFTASGSSFDLDVSPASSSGSVTVEFQGLPANQPLLWWNGSMWTRVLDAAGNAVRTNSSGSATVTITSATSPTIAQLTGTYILIGQVQPLVTVIDAGGTYSGGAFPATATVQGMTGSGSSLEGVSPTVSYYSGTTATGTPLSCVPTAAGTYTVVANFSGSTDYTSASDQTTFTIAQDSTSTALSAAVSGQVVTLGATVTAAAPCSTTPTGSVDFYDTTTGVDLTPGGVTLVGGKAAFTGALTLPGNQQITATYSGDGNFLTSNTAVTVAPSASLYVLNTSASGALTLSGNADINLPGVVDVDSSSASAITGSGNAVVTAGAVNVVGKVSTSGNAKISPKPATGAAAVADPFACLPVPSVTSSLQGAINVSGNSTQTIGPGIYSSITVSGNGTLTMKTGIYVIAGGGFSVSGNGTVTGANVLIYNAGSNYLSKSGTSFGAIILSGNAQVTLSALGSGPYAGVAIFQSRDNSQPMTLSGNDATSISGSIYAPAAALTLSGNAQPKDSLIVATINLSGNSIFNNVSFDIPSGAVAYTPAQLRTAYGVNSLALDGSGQTIAIVDAYDDPAIYQSLDQFDSLFGTTAAGSSLLAQYGPASGFLTVVNQNGQTTGLPGIDPSGVGTANWESEEALDVEWTHAMAPGAQIILVEANSQSLSDLMSAVSTAANLPGVSVVSMSWGFTEGSAVLAADEAMYDSDLTTPAGHIPVTFVASTGDYGTADPEYPAFSPNVLAVGGTTLNLNEGGSYNSETGWGSYSAALGSFIGSGGGVSAFEPEPAYQNGVQSTGYRTTPDVALVADPSTGAWIADAYNLSAASPMEVVGGTSLSAPSWAGLIALADQGRAAAGLPAMSSDGGTTIQAALYSAPAAGFNTITSGTNGGYTAAAGYNLVTGLGTPVANVLIPSLIAYAGTAAPNATASSGGPYGNGGGGTNVVFYVFDVMPAGSAASGRMGDTRLATPAQPAGGVADAVAPPAISGMASSAFGTSTPAASAGSTVAPLPGTQAADSLALALNDWVQYGAMDPATIGSDVTPTDDYSNANTPGAASGFDRFWETYATDAINQKPANHGGDAADDSCDLGEVWGLGLSEVNWQDEPAADGKAEVFTQG